SKLKKPRKYLSGAFYSLLQYYFFAAVGAFTAAGFAVLATGALPPFFAVVEGVAAFSALATGFTTLAAGLAVLATVALAVGVAVLVALGAGDAFFTNDFFSSAGRKIT